MSNNKNQAKSRRRFDGEHLSRGTKSIVLICALLGALLLWIYAIGYDSTLFESTFNGIAVTVTGEDVLAGTNGFTLAEEQDFSSVTVVASGKRSQLNELSTEDFSAVVDVSSVKEAGYATIPIVIYSPNGIEIVSQSSTTVTVFVDEFTQRDQLLSVSVDTGTGYVMSEGISGIESVANPLTVSVSGPKSVLDSIEGAYVNFKLDGMVIDKSLYGYGEIELRDADGNVVVNPYLKVSDTTAYVAINVKASKTVPVNVRFVGGVLDKSSATVVQSINAITVTGDPDIIKAFESVTLDIDESTIDGTADFEFQISPLLPEGVENSGGVSKVNVKVVLPAMSSRTFSLGADAIRFVNLPEGKTATPNGKMLVTFLGARDAINSLKKEFITATVDFDRVTENLDGTFSASPVIDAGSELDGVYILNNGIIVKFTLTDTID